MLSISSSCARGVVGLMLCGAVLSAAAGSEVRERYGKAFDRLSGELRYVEAHSETVVNGEVVRAEVRYLDSNGQLFATKSVDFEPSALQPEFRFQNTRTGHQEGFEREGDSPTILYRAGFDSSLKQASAPALGNAVVDAGFDRLIEMHWDRLFAGEVLKMDFLVPSRLDVVGFRVRRDDRPDAAVGDIVLEVDNALLRFVVNEIRVRYDPGTRRLLRYVGTSNVRDANGVNMDVRIEFSNTELALR